THARLSIPTTTAVITAPVGVRLSPSFMLPPLLDVLLGRLFPALHRLPLERVWAELAQLDPQTVQVGHVGQDGVREAAGRTGLGRRRTPLLERRDGRANVRRLQAEMIDPRRALRVGLL